MPVSLLVLILGGERLTGVSFVRLKVQGVCCALGGLRFRGQGSDELEFRLQGVLSRI